MISVIVHKITSHITFYQYVYIFVSILSLLFTLFALTYAPPQPSIGVKPYGLCQLSYKHEHLLSLHQGSW